MKRYDIKDILNIPSRDPANVYKNQVAVINGSLFSLEVAKELFAIDAFAIGYITQGYAMAEFNNDSYRLEPGSVFILTPTHYCRFRECSPDFYMRLLLLDANGYNLSIHLNHLVKSGRWTQAYFHPVIKLNEEESRIMNACTDRIVEQICRNSPNQVTLLRLATEWHHVELDNVIQIHQNTVTDDAKPLSRQQSLARELYILVVDNYKKEHQVSFYSDKMCMTPQYLNQITNRVMGKTLSTIISDLLFSTARTLLLSTDMSIQQIADELNFADQASFSKFIKKESGISPSTLRRTNPHQEFI